jgi:NAD(P)-dependent dehydrogenase (short-subunit alcohol dehydrogenase family)
VDLKIAGKTAFITGGGGGVASAIAHIVEELGAIDILVNAAGVRTPATKSLSFMST